MNREFNTAGKEESMDTQELRKFLAGLGIAGLLAGTTLMAGGCASNGSA
jgi:radical SAM modification target selenobiotic family peptide